MPGGPASGGAAVPGQAILDPLKGVPGGPCFPPQKLHQERRDVLAPGVATRELDADQAKGAVGKRSSGLPRPRAPRGGGTAPLQGESAAGRRFPELSPTPFRDEAAPRSRRCFPRTRGGGCLDGPVRPCMSSRSGRSCAVLSCSRASTPRGKQPYLSAPGRPAFNGILCGPSLPLTKPCPLPPIPSAYEPTTVTAAMGIMPGPLWVEHLVDVSSRTRSVGG